MSATCPTCGALTGGAPCGVCGLRWWCPLCLRFEDSRTVCPPRAEQYRRRKTDRAAERRKDFGRTEAAWWYGKLLAESRGEPYDVPFPGAPAPEADWLDGFCAHLAAEMARTAGGR